ncbi:hypothetical protein E4U55_000835 [Claviceps digitariae]|nr:hypothetical protein E4U55_000835 [Claviceps digitariae]
MNHSNGITDNAQPSAARVLGTRVQDSSGTDSDDRFDRLVEALEDTLTRQQNATTTHSFQIVRLQNQIQDLQNAKSRQDGDMVEAQMELHRSRQEIAYLKGRLAGLAMEFYLTSTANANASTSTKHEHRDEELVNKWAQDCWGDGSADAKHEASPQGELSKSGDGVVETSHAAGVVADEWWKEHRPGLIKALSGDTHLKNISQAPGRNA